MCVSACAWVRVCVCGVHVHGHALGGQQALWSPCLHGDGHTLGWGERDKQQVPGPREGAQSPQL